MQKLVYITILVTALFALNTNAQSKQDDKFIDAATVKKMVQNQNFDFVAQYITLDDGDQFFLKDRWGLYINKASVTAYLPYYGSYYFDATYDPLDRGINYSFAKFSYAVKPDNGNFNITIIPSDAKYYQKIFLWVSSTGQATLSINFTQRKVFFKGYIQPGETTMSKPTR